MTSVHDGKTTEDLKRRMENIKQRWILEYSDSSRRGHAPTEDSVNGRTAYSKMLIRNGVYDFGKIGPHVHLVIVLASIPDWALVMQSIRILGTNGLIMRDDDDGVDRSRTLSLDMVDDGLVLLLAEALSALPVARPDDDTVNKLDSALLPLCMRILSDVNRTYTDVEDMKRSEFRAAWDGFTHVIDESGFDFDESNGTMTSNRVGKQDTDDGDQQRNQVRAGSSPDVIDTIAGIGDIAIQLAAVLLT